MLEIMMFFNAVMETLSHLKRPLGRLLVQPVMTAALLTALWAGYNCVREWSIGGGLWVAFFETNAGRASRLRERDDAILQAELRHLAKANKVIDQLLESALEHAPNAARARLDVVHNGVTGLTGIGLLRYDTTNSVAGPGHSAGPLVQNRPLTEWSDFLPEMLEGECRIYGADALRSLAVRARLETLNVGTILVCPVTDVQGRLLGGVFLLWDSGTRIPEGTELETLTALVRQVGRQIASVVDLRIPQIWPKG